MAIGAPTSTGHNNGTTSVVVTVAITAGETGVVCVENTNGTGGVTGISGGGTWSQKTSNAFTGTTAQRIFTEIWTTAAGGATSASSVTVSVNGAPTTTSVVAASYPGVLGIGNAATPVGFNQGSPQTITMSTQDNNNWVIAAFGSDDGSDGAYTASGAGVVLRDSALFSGAIDSAVVLTDNSRTTPGTVTNGVVYSLAGYSIVALELRSVSGVTPPPTFLAGDDDSFIPQVELPGYPRISYS